MKTIIAVACLVAFTLAEPPPSNSYLPPSPSSGRSGGGYPRGGPGVVAARTLDGLGAGAKGFGRASPHNQGAQGRFGLGPESQGYDQNASPFGRNGLDDETREPANYNFGYMVNDFLEGTDFGHHEERQDERAEGEYHVVLPDGRKQTVSYEADETGFKPRVSYEDTDALTRSNGGYDANANNVRSSPGIGSGFKNGGPKNGLGSHGNGNHGDGIHGDGNHGDGNHGNGRHGSGY